MLRLASLVVLLVVLAGCSSSPSGSTPVDTPLPTVVSTVAPEPEAPLVLTDTLHMLVSPHLTGHAPKSEQDTRIALPDFAHFQEAPTWEVPISNPLAQVAMHVDLWVDVQGFVAQQVGPSGKGCFWDVQLFAWAADNQSAVGTSGCIEEGVVVPDGVRELQVPILLSQPVPTGSRLEVTIMTAALPYAPGASATLLTASVTHDSRVQVTDLQLPIDTLTLL